VAIVVATRPEASIYAVVKSFLAVVSKTAYVTLQGSGPEASTEYIVPVTSKHVNTGAGGQAAGLKPTSPLITEGVVSLTADPARTAKLPAVPRPTGEVARSRLADTEDDGPVNESDINRIINIDKYFSLCILFGLPPKTSNQGSRSSSY
jgi:hypothetical protein